MLSAPCTAVDRSRKPELAYRSKRLTVKIPHRINKIQIKMYIYQKHYLWPRAQIYLSIITEMELLCFQNLTNEETSVIKRFIDNCTVINITQQIKERAIHIRKTSRTKLPDSIIAATCQFLDIPLITSDSDFRKVEHLNILIYEP